MSRPTRAPATLQPQLRPPCLSHLLHDRNVDRLRGLLVVVLADWSGRAAWLAGWLCKSGNINFALLGSLNSIEANQDGKSWLAKRHLWPG